MEAYAKSLQNCYDCHKHFRIDERAKSEANNVFIAVAICAGLNPAVVKA